jgi:hypothetical protein
VIINNTNILPRFPDTSEHTSEPPLSPALDILRRLVKNLDQLSMYLKPCQFDVLIIDEARLDSSIKDYEVGIVGYEIVRKDRNRNGSGWRFT